MKFLTESDCKLTISGGAFAYLSVQQGAINDLASDRTAWEAAYHARLFETYQSIAPFLPVRCPQLLDIGSGLGGIDVLVSRHYRGKVTACLMDGTDDSPICTSHAGTFNSERVTRAFMADNGVGIRYYAPGSELEDNFALVMSFASWCFHYPPAKYLDLVRNSLTKKGALILDVRRAREDWKEKLASAFSEKARAFEGRKFDRMVYASLGS
jgi:SAM-dependent methyltransferase